MSTTAARRSDGRPWNRGSSYQDEHLRDLPCRRLQLDELWSFVYAKAKNAPADRMGDAGDWWTWVAIDADTKLVPAWLIGDRSTATARVFVADLASRLANRVQITTDGHRPYLEAIEGAFGADVDYAQLVKLYGPSPEPQDVRYSSSECIGTETHVRAGEPDERYISTSYVERQNLTMRMSMRRFTRLTNAFSKKVSNHAAAVALHYMHYNFARPHRSLGRNVTPAMAAGVSNHVWTAEEIAALLD